MPLNSHFSVDLQIFDTKLIFFNFDINFFFLRYHRFYIENNTIDKMNKTKYWNRTHKMAAKLFYLKWQK